ncbi:MAG: PD-(D/E)XK nuclease family protein [Bacteroidales bacterium]|nr:PD-(D/E)XK nuclease family protein [Bacteroidales bacterium]
MTSQDILKRLHNLPIFRLSLGSKELFHSNFLEYLWDCDKSSFIAMIQTFCGESVLSDKEVEYKISREKENFDICIYHTNGRGNKQYYDLIIENKVKSIPYKEQLVKYVEKVEAKRTKKNSHITHYLLLSLAKQFPDKGNGDTIEVSYEIDKRSNEKKSGKASWKVIDYGQLKTAIEAQKGWQDKPFVKEYCEFIGYLDLLGDSILANMGTEFIFHDVADFRKERLHDLYLKIRCNKFLLDLKAMLRKAIPDETIPIEFRAHEEIRKKNEKGIFLNANIFSGAGQAAACIYEGPRNDRTGGYGDIYEIVVQGDQYRHGINQYQVEKHQKGNKDDQKKLAAMWQKLTEDPTTFSSKFLKQDIMGCQMHQQQGEKPFNSYNNDYVYKYVKIRTERPDDSSPKKKRTGYQKDPEVATLLEEMKKDIINTARNLNFF